MTPKDPLFGGEFLGQILAADSLPGAFVHFRDVCNEVLVELFLCTTPSTSISQDISGSSCISSFTYSRPDNYYIT